MITLRYWPLHLPAPLGWRDYAPLGGNHGNYSRIIVRTWLGALCNRNPRP